MKARSGQYYYHGSWVRKVSHRLLRRDKAVRGFTNPSALRPRNVASRCLRHARRVATKWCRIRGQIWI